VELSLKARVCRTLGWTEFPNEAKEWGRHHAFLKVHDLKRLSRWTGYEAQLKLPAYDQHWKEVREWNPETRYQVVGAYSRQKALSIIRSTRTLVDLLNPR
jgi:hypothetical protein